jgi:hypothetical protein
MAYALLPDMDQELVDFLTAHASLAPLHGGRVGTELQSDMVALQVTGLGGTQPWPWTATAEYQIAAWGAVGSTQAQANTLIRTVVAAIYDMTGTGVDGGRVTGVAVTLAPLWSPDETTGRPRYIAHVGLTIYPP